MSHHRQALYDLGCAPTLELTSVEASALTAEDLAELRHEHGASPAMIARLRTFARVSGRRMLLNFKRQTVTLERGR